MNALATPAAVIEPYAGLLRCCLRIEELNTYVQPPSNSCVFLKCSSARCQTVLGTFTPALPASCRPSRANCVLELSPLPL